MSSSSKHLTHSISDVPDVVEECPVILSIDDDPEISRAIEIRLRRYHVVVLSAFYGMQGFWLAMTEQPDLIITDMKMPQGQGDDIVECLKRNSETQDIPVLVLTGDRDKGLKNKMLNLGVKAYLTKPCAEQELTAAIEQLVELRPVEFA